jgi:hypothetical protein
MERTMGMAGSVLVFAFPKKIASQGAAVEG